MNMIAKSTIKNIAEITIGILAGSGFLWGWHFNY